MKIAITGGIGTGKSTIIEHLKTMMPEYTFMSVDEAVAIAHDTHSIIAFKNALGIHTKEEMSNFFFENPGLQRKFEDLINPLIKASIDTWLDMDNVVIEFPLLYRGDCQHYVKEFDLVVSVSTNQTDRILRVKERNPSFSHDKILKIISHQPDQSVVNSRADIVIENDGSRSDVKNAVENFVEVIRQKELSSCTKQGSLINNTVKTGIVSGSFDPIQLGHLYVIKKALKLVDTLHIVIGYNDTKTPHFTNQEKQFMILDSIAEILGEDAKQKSIHVDILEKDQLLIEYAREAGAKFIFRGLRSGFDFDYEHSINAAQYDIDESIETIYIMTPNHLTQVSSSLVKQLNRYPAADVAVQKYVTKAVLKVLHAKRNLPQNS